MGLLYGCFCIVDCMLMVEGLRRWYCLRFFIHPLPLLLCELYVAGRILLRYLISASIYPYKLFRSGMYRLVVIMGLDDASIIELYGFEIEDEEEARERWFDAYEEEEDPYTSITVLYGSASTAPRVLFSPRYGSPSVFDQFPLAREYRWRKEPKESRAADVCHSIDVEEDDRRNGLVRWSGKEVRGEEVEAEECKEELEAEECEEELEREEEELGDVDDVQETRGSFDEDLASLPRRPEQDSEFYQEYAKLMGILDRLREERITVISVLLGVGIRELLGDMKTHMRILHQKLQRDHVGLAQAMEMDLEMVYVGQSCLSWEALHNYYGRFEELVAEDRTGASGCYQEAAEKFQQFHVSLERFLEKERYEGRYEGKRSWNYVQGRKACWNILLQVPRVSGYEEEENDGNELESMTAEQVLLNIEKCIRSFSCFLDADNVKSKKKPKGLLGDAESPVEDLNDFGLLCSLIHEVRKKRMGLEKLRRGKKHWWKKRTASLDNSQKIEVLFSMIDIKLVSRVLKMSSIPRKHLNWCEKMLSNIHISEGNITRISTVSFFPPV